MCRCKLKVFFFSEYSVIRIISTVKKLRDHNKLTAIFSLVKVGLQFLRSESLEKKN
jgi:hypothetical protein